MGITSNLRRLARATNAVDIKKIAKELKKDPNIDNKLIDEVEAATQAALKGKRVQFKEDYEVQEATRVGRSGFSDKAEYEVESGEGGKPTVGRRSEASFADQETSNTGRVARNKRVAELETKAEKGEITKAEQKELDRLDALSEESDVKRARTAATTRSIGARKDRGISLMGMEGVERVGAKTKYKTSELIGSNTNGIVRETGEILGNPTPNQIKMAVRDLEARTRLSAAAKRNLAKLKSMSTSDRQSAALRKMERNLKDTGADKSGRPFARGGLATKRKGHTDMRAKGLFR